VLDFYEEEQIKADRSDCPRKKRPVSRYAFYDPTGALIIPSYLKLNGCLVTIAQMYSPSNLELLYVDKLCSIAHFSLD
jgi:hypothetical protein